MQNLKDKILKAFEYCEKQSQNQKLLIPAEMLLVYNDEDFIHMWKYGSEMYAFIGGSETNNKINERAKNLGLK
jgi:hypothetical protein